jgi:hypothetical protein
MTAGASVMPLAWFWRERHAGGGASPRHDKYAIHAARVKSS